MHLVINFASEANTILKTFENNVVEGSNPQAFNSDECGTSILIRTCAEAFTEYGSD